MKHILLTTLLALPLPFLALPVLAQTMDHSGHQMAGDQNPSSQAYAAANAKMHAEMAIPLTGNPDVDFIAGMIPHHQGAVDSARIVLQYGTDPEVRKFAEDVIAAQEAEITWMQDWLAKQPK
jgi:uncharacterized protein (DUF305 family)